MATQNLKSETKRDKFVRVCRPRVRRALKAIRVIGQCTGPAYEIKKQDVDSIINVLTNEIATIKKAFEKPKQKQEPTFDFG